MCGRFSFHTLDKLKKIMEILEMEPPANLSVNIAPHTEICTIYNNRENISAIRNMHWQLIPYFCEEFYTKYSMFNTRSDTLFEKKFKKNLITTQRCLIPANCYYEWKNEDSRKIPYSFELEGEDIIFLGGIYSIWQSPDGVIQKFSCSIITTDAAPEVSDIYNRMPLIIKKPQTSQWLDKTLMNTNEISEMIKPYTLDDLKYKRLTRIS